MFTLLASPRGDKQEQRTEDGGSNSVRGDWTSATVPGCRLAVLLWVQRVVRNREGLVLFDGDRRIELVAKGLAMSIVGE